MNDPSITVTIEWMQVVHVENPSPTLIEFTGIEESVKPVPLIVSMEPAEPVPDVGKITIDVRAKAVVSYTILPLAVTIIFPEVWALTVNVAENVPAWLLIVLVIV